MRYWLERFEPPRSHVHRLGLEHGLDYARAVLEADHAKDALARRQVRVSPLLPEADGGLSSPSVALTGLRRFGASLVRVHPANRW